MDDEIDLRPYIELLLKRWYWIVGVAALAGVIAFVASSLMPPTYEATALVAVTQSRESVQFEPRIRTVEEGNTPLSAYPELAMSDGLITELLEELNSTPSDVNSTAELRQIVEAVPGSNPSLVRLKVRHGDPRSAADIANIWAGLFVTRANAVFDDQNSTQVQFFEEELEKARDELEAADEALIDFEGRNRTLIIGNELEALLEMQADYLHGRQSLTLLLQDVQGLRDQLSEQSGDAPATLADQLTVLSLQLKAFNAAFDAGDSMPLQLQFGSTDGFANTMRGEQIAALDALYLTLEGRLAEPDEEVAALEPQILTLQQELQQTGTEAERLGRDKNVAEETYLALARKVDEVRISTDEIGSGVRRASTAAVPEQPVGRSRLINTVLAVVLVAMISVFVILAHAWWGGVNAEEGSLELDGATE